MSAYAVIDFETTGISPGQGARPTEIGVVLVRDGQLVDRYQSLMNPGRPIPWEIQQLTGITDAMVRRAPPVESVMAEAAAFAAGHVPVAHNAAFDRRFWETELRDIGLDPGGAFVCSLLLSRRIFPSAPNHKLGTLAEVLALPDTGRHHRALADAEITAHLLLRLEDELRSRFRLSAVPPALWMRIQSVPRQELGRCVTGFGISS